MIIFLAWRKRRVPRRRKACGEAERRTSMVLRKAATENSELRVAMCSCRNWAKKLYSSWKLKGKWRDEGLE